MLSSLVVALVASSISLLGEPCDPAGPPCTTPFGDVGTLVIHSECVLFAAESGALYQIADAGPFGDGDLVWVSGTLQAFCPGRCLKSTSGCILDNIIGTPFQGCGTLQLGPQSCTIFAADSGQGFFLENEGGFQIGDRVYVEGCVDQNSPFCQPLIVVGLQDNTIEPCFEVCGTIQLGPQGCTILNTPEGAFVPATTGGLSLGDCICVAGQLVPESFACFPVNIPAIDNNSLAACPPSTHFDGCGMLAQGPELCALFEAADGQTYELENAGGFEPGDQVCVAGVVVPRSGACPRLNLPGIEDNTIGKCFHDCGTLIEGVECTLFKADAGGVFELSDLGGFAAGDCVCVTGCLNGRCASFCQQGDGCIEANTIAACRKGQPFAGCGELAPGPQGCFWFNADSGGSFFIENVGRFGTGDRVYVEGTLIPDFMCFPPVGPGIVDNTIENCFDLCGTLGPGPQSCTLVVGKDGRGFAIDNPGGFGFGDLVFVSGKLVEDSSACFPAQISAIENNSIAECFSGCGTLVIPILCPVALASDDGSGIYVLENLGKFGPNDVVFVEGAIDPDCKDGGTCPCIDNNIITKCPGGPDADINRDGAVDGADLGLLLGAFGSCPNCELIARNADLNGDCKVDGSDLGILLGRVDGVKALE